MSDKLKKASPWDPETSARPLTPGHKTVRPMAPVISSAPTPNTGTTALKPTPAPAKQPAKPATGTMPTWHGATGEYPILHPSHADELETLAAINEFHSGMPRSKAEAEAHKFYQDKQRKSAAAHHLRGMRIAEQAGNNEAAAKHSMMYKTHLAALGHNDIDQPPHDIETLARQSPQGPGYNFKAHIGDQFAVADHVRKSEVEEKALVVYALAKTAEALAEKKEKSPEEKAMKAKDRSAKASQTSCPECGNYKAYWANLCAGCHKKKHVIEKTEPGDEVNDPPPFAKAGPVRTVPGEQLHGKRVYAYRNLHNGLFSLWHKGKVIAHVPEVHLDDAKFVVREAGRKKVLREQKKNVHAFVVGTVNHGAKPASDAVPVTYNPYMHPPEQSGSFVRASDKAPIAGAKSVHLGLQTTPEGKQRAFMNAVEHAPKAEEPEVKKGELSAEGLKRKAGTCRCSKYSFPHRKGGGHCK